MKRTPPGSIAVSNAAISPFLSIAGPDVVRIAALSFNLARLHLETLLLRGGVVDLGERVAELHPAGEVLEPLRQRRVVVGGARER